MVVIEKLTSSDGVHHRVHGVVDDVVRGHRRQIGRALSENAPLEANNVVFRQQVIGIRHVAAETGLIHALANVALNLVYRVLEALGDSVTSKRLDVEAVGLGGEDHEGNHCFVRLGLFQLLWKRIFEFSPPTFKFEDVQFIPDN